MVRKISTTKPPPCHVFLSVASIRPEFYRRSFFVWTQENNGKVWPMNITITVTIICHIYVGQVIISYSGFRWVASYQTRFGQPSFFLPLTPNTVNSYAMAHCTDILSVGTLFDSLQASIPSVTVMKKATMLDDCTPARLFMRTVEAFIERRCTRTSFLDIEAMMPLSVRAIQAKPGRHMCRSATA